MCYVSKMVSKFCGLCWWIWGCFFSFLNNGCKISRTIFLGPPTLAGCMGQTPTDRIWPTRSNQQDRTGKEQPSSSPRWTKERSPSAASWNCYKTIALWYILFIQRTSNLCKEGEDKNIKAQNAGGRGREETQPYRKTKGKGFTKD